MNERRSRYGQIQPDFYKAISHPTRRHVLRVLYDRYPDEVLYGELYKEFVDEFSKPAFSGHIKELINAGLIVGRQEAQYRYYKINPEQKKQIEKLFE
jgi:Predicted transcriptional regulators